MDPWDAYIVKRAIARLEPDPARFLFGLCTRSEGESVENVAERLGYSTDAAKNYARTVYSALQLKGKSRAITPEICQLFFEVAGVGSGEEPDWNRWPPPEPERPPSTVVLMPAAEAPQPEQLDIANDRPFWRRSFSRRQQFFGVAIAVAGLVFIAFLIFGNGDEPPEGDSPTADGTAPGGIGQVTPGDSPTEETQPQETPAPSPVVLPSATNTRQPTETPTITLTPSITPTPTDTPTPTSTATPTVTPTPTNTPTPSATPLSVASSWANDRVALSIAGHEFNAFDVKGVIGYRFAALFTFRYENFSGGTISLRFNGENFRLTDDSGVLYVCRASIGGHYQEQEQMTLSVPSGGEVEFNIGCGRDEVIGQGVISAFLITTAFSSLGESRWYIEVPG